MNKTIVTGNLKANPRESTMPSGTVASNFDIAVDRVWIDPEGNTQKQTTWFRIEVTNASAGPCNQYLYKGRKVLVEGHLVADKNGNPRIWADREGNPRATFVLRAQSVEFMDNPKRDNAQSSSEGSETPQDIADNIPF